MIAPLLVTVKDDALGGLSRRAIAATDETEAMMPLCAYDLDRAGLAALVAAPASRRGPLAR